MITNTAAHIAVVLLLSLASVSGADTNSSKARGVACLGRIAPANGILKIAQPASRYPGLSPIAELSVKEGDVVKKGQLIAVLENKSRLETAWKSALAQARIAESRLAQIKAGSNPADVAAQQADIERLAAEVEAARINHERSETLKRDAAISVAGFQATQLALETRVKMLDAAKERLKSLAEVRSVDVAVAEAQFQAAVAEAEHAKAELEQAFIRAPVDGKIVRVHAHAGEQIGPHGVAEIAEIELMYVIAEVHESDIKRVKVGQRASITGSVLAEALSGVVEQISSKVGKNSLFSTDPASANDAQVVEVKIRLDQAAPADRFLNARVTAILEP